MSLLLLLLSIGSIVDDVDLVADDDRGVRVAISLLLLGLNLLAHMRHAVGLHRLVLGVVVALRIDLLARLRCNSGRAHMLLVLHREAVLLERIQLVTANMLNRVERLAALLHRRRRGVVVSIWVCSVALSGCLLQLCERALINTFDELRLDWHIWVLVQHFVTSKQEIVLCILLLNLCLDDLARGIVVARIIHREGVCSLSMVN